MLYNVNYANILKNLLYHVLIVVTIPFDFLGYIISNFSWQL